jgi:prevent-host-death family protein
MDVAISDLRSHLSAWVDRVQEGEEVVITERGIPVVRMMAVDAAPMLRRLVDEGVVAAPSIAARASASSSARVRATASVAERVSDQRR